MRRNWSARVMTAVTGLALLSSCTSTDPSPSPGSSWPSLPPPSSQDTPCPTGESITVGPSDAASGFRAQTLILTNCGTESYPLNGYPEVTLLSADGQPLDAKVATEGEGPLDGSGKPLDPGPADIALPPQQTAYVILTWTNRVTGGTAVNAEKISIASLPGKSSIVLDLLVDLGDTDTARVTAWQKGAP